MQVHYTILISTTPNYTTIFAEHSVPQVAGIIALSASVKQFCLSAPSGLIPPPSRLIHHSSSVIHHPFISTSLCVFRLTKGTLMGEKKK